MFRLNWLKELISMSVSGKRDKVKDTGNYSDFPDHTKWFSFCSLQTHESSLGYRYLLSYLTLTSLLEERIHFLFIKITCVIIQYNSE